MAKRTPLPVAPWQQGQLDGLCGIYAIVNALQLLAPYEVDEELSDRLFAAMLKRLAADGILLDAITNGLCPRGLTRCLAAACERFHESTGLRVPIRWSRPLARRRGLQRVDDLWSALRELLPDERRDSIGHRRVLLIGWNGNEAHWSAVHRAGAKRLHLFDSDGGSTIKRKRCREATDWDTDLDAKPYALLQSHVFLLERVHPSSMASARQRPR